MKIPKFASIDSKEVMLMATLTIRNLPEETRRALKARAAHNDRSMEAEVRAILEEAVKPAQPDLLSVIHSLRHKTGGVVFDTPQRSTPRDVELE